MQFLQRQETSRNITVHARRHRTKHTTREHTPCAHTNTSLFHAHTHGRHHIHARMCTVLIPHTRPFFQVPLRTPCARPRSPPCRGMRNGMQTRGTIPDSRARALGRRCRVVAWAKGARVYILAPRCQIKRVGGKRQWRATIALCLMTSWRHT